MMQNSSLREDLFFLEGELVGAGNILGKDIFSYMKVGYEFLSHESSFRSFFSTGILSQTPPQEQVCP